MRMLIAILVLFFVPIAIADGTKIAQRQVYSEKQYTIFAGTPKGTYTRIAEDIQRACSPREIHTQTTDGSLTNLRLLDEDSAIKSGARFALSQQDVMQNYLKQNPKSKVQAVMPMYSEDISVIVTRKSGVKSLKDLTGKRVAIGSPGSGNWFTAHSIQTYIGISWLSVEVSPEEGILSLLIGDIDAMIIVAGHPVKLLSELGDRMQSLIVMLSLPELPQYPQSKLSSNTYPWQPYDVEARSTRSVLVAASDVSREEINELLACISSQRAALRKWGHAKWNEVSFATRSSTLENRK